MDHHQSQSQPHSRRESFSVSVSTSTTTTTTTFKSEPEIDPSPLLSSSDNLLPEFPFGRIEGLDRDDLRETAYEIFFTACRSSPGFGGKNAMTYPPPAQDSIGDGGGGGGIGGYGLPRTNGLNLVATSKVKRALGLKTAARRTIPSRKTSPNSNPSSPRVMSPSSNLNSGSGSGFGGFGVGGGGGGGGGGGLGFVTPLMRLKRPLTAAEIMKQQMRISEQSDNRLRKTLMRTLVGQMGRRVETIIIPLELLRHLKVGDFSSTNDYHLMQKRQLKILEAGLLLHPSVPLDPTNISAMQLREIIRESEAKPIDTGRNSETVRMLCNSVVSLSLRSISGGTADVCHWADGFPMNIHLYISLLHSIFDIKEPTSVLDEVDELLELIKKTWSTLGINKVIHNVCFMWVLFQRYASTAQVEQDLLCASHVMLAEVANDTKKIDRDRRDVIYIKVLSSTLTSMVLWSEKRLLDYHESFHKGTAGLMDSLLPLVLLAARILDEDVPSLGVVQERGDPLVAMGNKVDNYIRTSMKNAFAKHIKKILHRVVEEQTPVCQALDSTLEKAEPELEKLRKLYMILNGTNCMSFEAEEASESLLQLAKDTESLATKERDHFSPILKKWHPVAAGVAASTLHSCYRAVLKQFLDQFTMLNNETVGVLQIAGKLEKELIQMVVETSVDCEEAGKVVIRGMEPYEVDSIILKRLKAWIEESLKKGRQCFERSKETETWNPKSKTEPYAQSAVNIMKLVHESIDDFFEIPVSISDDLVHDLADGLELLVLEYTSFVASCGSKQSYIPPLPPLTRCNQDSKLTKLWRKATPCRAGSEEMFRVGSTEGNHPRPSTSRGTQRLYIRLNTLQYILAYLHSVDKSLSLSRRQNPLPRNRLSNHGRHLSSSPCYFDLARSSILAACQNVAEIAAYRLVFLDSNSVFYESLYTFDVANSRIRPALRILKQNLTLLTAILMDQVQALAIKEVMKATFEAYLMVLLAGGGMRSFSITDHEMIEEDFESLKRAFCARGEGMVAEEVVEREAETVEGVVGLMGQSTERLVEDFSIVACEVSGLGRVGAGQKVPMPPTTGRWNRADPNTILRVLCYRNDSLANSFLKKTFQLAKRR